MDSNGVRWSHRTADGLSKRYYQRWWGLARSSSPPKSSPRCPLWSPNRGIPFLLVAKPNLLVVPHVDLRDLRGAGGYPVVSRTPHPWGVKDQGHSCPISMRYDPKAMLNRMAIKYIKVKKPQISCAISEKKAFTINMNIMNSSLGLPTWKKDALVCKGCCSKQPINRKPGLFSPLNMGDRLTETATISIWVNYNISLTWNKAIIGDDSSY